MIPFLLSIASLLSAFVTMWAQHTGQRPLVYFCKPLTTILISLLALASPAPFGLYKAAVATGLLCSLAGDVCLMLPGDKFLQGLFSFLLAHLCYLAAFSWQTGWTFSWWSVGLLLLGFGLMTRVLPHSGQLRYPALGYALVILAMWWRAFEFWLNVGSPQSWLVLVGATLFALSDSLLAYNRFIKHLALVHWLVLGTYYAAQWCLAVSA